MPRVPQYQPHQAGPVETTPARLRPTDNSFGIAGGIAAGLPRLAQALQDHGARQDEELRRDDAYARDLALGLQRDIGSLTRDFAGLSGKAAADAGAEAKARILALESAALDQASNPRMRTMLENLSAGPLAQALDLVAAHSRRGLRQMGGEAARGERDLAIEGALAAHADPAAMAQARRQVIEANARLAEAEEWDEARFGEENARTLSDMHTRMVRAVLDDGGDIDLAGAYFEANRDEMAARDIALTEATLRGPRELAESARVVDEAIAAGAIEAGDTDTAFDLAGTIRHIKARPDLSEAQRQNALAQARKHHSVAQAALSDKHEAGRKAFERWAEQVDFDRALYVQDGEVPESIRAQLSPPALAALDQLRDENRARMEENPIHPTNKKTPKSGTILDANFKSYLTGHGLYSYLNQNTNRLQQSNEEMNRTQALPDPFKIPVAQQDSISENESRTISSILMRISQTDYRNSSIIIPTDQDLILATRHTESENRDYKENGNRNINERSGARFAMQVLPETARNPGYGATPTNQINNPSEMNRVGSELLLAFRNRHNGDLAKMWADFNHGSGNVNRILRNHRDDWFEQLPTETKNYIIENLQRLDEIIYYRIFLDASQREGISHTSAERLWSLGRPSLAKASGPWVIPETFNMDPTLKDEEKRRILQEWRNRKLR
ncbi:hypothetical protein GRI97_07050 [Altererythrobacter xixiisoli]|uniref:Transglycosylase SLT domain-containing protein n=1 Tax=Croceibacterium xixiisoli TaxID=1476466 RepID=A0A6I4TTU7_9SPHN|nr:lytic transglycosylase domain-containing protein [Croceibacterium xixiisoli]MXO98739.1 hypothetical protein [Croceibacterium xixiisoli]